MTPMPHLSLLLAISVVTLFVAHYWDRFYTQF